DDSIQYPEAGGAPLAPRPPGAAGPVPGSAVGDPGVLPAAPVIANESATGFWPSFSDTNVPVNWEAVTGYCVNPWVATGPLFPMSVAKYGASGASGLPGRFMGRRAIPAVPAITTTGPAPLA